MNTTTQIRLHKHVLLTLITRRSLKRDLPFVMQLSSFMWFGVGSAIRNTQGHLDVLTAGVTDQTTVLQISGLPLCISMHII